MLGRVVEIRTYPVKGDPPVVHDACRVEDEGLEGDRRKKAPVFLVGADDADRAKANLVLDVPAAALAAAIGQVVRVGEVELGLGSTSGSCPGSYADVVTPGTVRVGDPVEVIDS